jgi:glycosyltransferase involved in cell wall biosynthesis
LEGRVKFAGPVTPGELAELMSAADVFCLASLREGWPNVVHEALACGCPVIASKVGGVPDMIPDGESGTIVPCRDQQALNAALQAALERTWNRASISEKARERSWEQVAAEVFTELEQVRVEHLGQREAKPCVS